MDKGRATIYTSVPWPPARRPAPILLGRGASDVSTLSLLALAAALAMDALAVAVVVGLSGLPLTGRRIFRLSFHFGLFQALMPTLGWLAGSTVQRYLAPVDHWVALGLLSTIGGRMLWGAVHGESDGDESQDATRGWRLIALSVATSVDAFAAGLSLALLGVHLLVPVIVIGLVAALFTVVGMSLGRRIGLRWGGRIEALGGLLLIGLGVKIVVEHLSAS